MVLYCSKTTHTWIEKAAVLFGHGSKCIRWIPTHADNTMNTEILPHRIKDDLKNGKKPLMVAATA